ncbi:aspartate aminotransferase family protein [Streptacidiphilus sp. N1-3]|uniref:Aspartate aminotransferase family protein n=1 Tax=Streptacidiphilus alkalitolerans TaxID=3342712 RepID=A0ABV6XB18_9ACTN
MDPGQQRLVLVGGSGSSVVDDVGRSYLDLRAGTLNATVGYGHPTVVRALSRQAAVLMTWDLAEVTTEPAALLAERIADLLPDGLSRTLLCNSGSEATEAAVKIARQWHELNRRPERTWVLSFGDGYHGATALGIATTSSPFRREGAGPLPGGFAHLDTPRCTVCLTEPGHAGDCEIPGPARWEEQMLRLGPDRIAAVLVEPVLSVGGVIVPPPGHLRGLRDLCEKYGIVLICDEVATGFGRTGRWFGFEHELGPQAGPDIVTTAKGLAGGYAPLSAVTVRQDIYQAFAKDPLLGGLRHGHTTGGHATACAAALAVLDVVRDQDLVRAAADRGAQLLRGLQPLRRFDGVREVRGRGLLVGVEMVSLQAAADVAAAAHARGVLVRHFGPVLTLAPPLVITEQEIAAGVAAVTDAVAAAVGGQR